MFTWNQGLILREGILHVRYARTTCTLVIWVHRSALPQKCFPAVGVASAAPAFLCFLFPQGSWRLETQLWTWMLFVHVTRNLIFFVQVKLIGPLGLNMLVKAAAEPPQTDSWSWALIHVFCFPKRTSRVIVTKPNHLMAQHSYLQSTQPQKRNRWKDDSRREWSVIFPPGWGESPTHTASHQLQVGPA